MKPRSGNHKIAKRNFPSCSQKRKLLLPNAPLVTTLLKPRSGNHKIAKRNFPSCSLRSQFTASQKLPLLFPNAPLVTTNGLHLDDLEANHLNPTRSQHTKPVTGNQHRKKKLPLLLTSFAIHCLTKASAFVPQCFSETML